MESPSRPRTRSPRWGSASGAAMAGRKVLTSTSGPGMSLYSENIGPGHHRGRRRWSSSTFSGRAPPTGSATQGAERRHPVHPLGNLRGTAGHRAQPGECRRGVSADLPGLQLCREVPNPRLSPQQQGDRDDEGVGGSRGDRAATAPGAEAAAPPARAGTCPTSSRGPRRFRRSRISAVHTWRGTPLPRTTRAAI